MKVLSPVSESSFSNQKNDLTPRPKDLKGKTVGFICNQAGKIYFERIEELLREQCHVKDVILWIKKDQLTPAPPDTIDAVAKTCDVVVSGTGVCGSCTSGSVLDGINMERKGVPSVIIVHERFEVAAKTNAMLMKMPKAKVVVITEGTGNLTLEEQRKLTNGVWPQILKALTASYEM
jgi:hypothetical protein